jgi:phosphatidylserine/phosphatidylglycerophosphate/cardiolipin synthase-like enzyme
MHNKVLVVDQQVVVTGNYNFSQNATHNAENIITLLMGPLHANTSNILKISFRGTSRLGYRHSQYLFQYIEIKII